METDERPKTPLNSRIRKILKELRKTNLVAIPTDKTNGVQLLDLNTYKKQVKKHLESSATEIKREILTDLYEEAKTMAENVEIMLSDNENAFLLEGIESKAIPTPKLLIKDHKKKINDEYPTRLIIPATNFTATFSKLGYLGLKAILDENKILGFGRSLYFCLTF